MSPIVALTIAEHNIGPESTGRRILGGNKCWTSLNPAGTSLYQGSSDPKLPDGNEGFGGPLAGSASPRPDPLWDGSVGLAGSPVRNSMTAHCWVFFLFSPAFVVRIARREALGVISMLAGLTQWRFFWKKHVRFFYSAGHWESWSEILEYKKNLVKQQQLLFHSDLFLMC